MVYGRSRYRRRNKRRPSYRRAIRRRRGYRRRPRMRRCMRANGSRTVLGFKRVGTGGTIQVTDGDGVGQNSGAWSFRLDQITGYSELTNLFDNYMINAVVIKYWWHQDASTVDNNLIATPILHYCIDNNDITNPASRQAMSQYSTYRTHQFRNAQSFTVKIYPKAQVATYRTAVSTAYGPKKMWISTSYPDAPHYGYKYWIDGSQTASGGTGNADIGGLTYQLTYYVSVKNSN